LFVFSFSSAEYGVNWVAERSPLISELTMVEGSVTWRITSRSIGGLPRRNLSKATISTVCPAVAAENLNGPVPTRFLPMSAPYFFSAALEMIRPPMSDSWARTVRSFSLSTITTVFASGASNLSRL
jgi:hypothetical protein